MKMFKKLPLVAAAVLLLAGCSAQYDKSFYESEYNTSRVYKMCDDCIYAPVNTGDGIIEYDMSSLTYSVIKYDTEIFRGGIFFAAIPSGFAAIDADSGMTGVSGMTDTEQYLDLHYLNMKGETVDTVRINKVKTEQDNSQICDRYVDRFSSFAAYKGYIYGNVNDKENETHITRCDPLKNERRVLLESESGLFSLAGISDGKIYLIKTEMNADDCFMIVLSADDLTEVRRIKLENTPLAVSVYSDDTAIVDTGEGVTVYKAEDVLSGGILQTGECISYADGNFYYISGGFLYKTDDINDPGEAVAEDVTYAENIYEKYIVLDVNYSVPSSDTDGPVRFYDVKTGEIKTVSHI